MNVEKYCAKPKGIICLFLTGFVFASLSIAALDAAFEDIPGYEHDASWPLEREQFHWGVDEGAELDTSQSATGIGVDKNRDLVYALVRNAPHVRVFTTDGRFVDSWSPAKVARVHMLHVEQSGNIWIADNYGHTVTKYTPQGKTLLSLGTFGEAGMDASHFAEPTDVSTTADGKTIFISDGYANKRIVKFDQTGKYLGMWGGKEAGKEDGQFILPHSLTVLDNRVYVADREGARVQVFDLDGNFITDWRDILMPWAIASLDKYILVAGERLPESKNTETIASLKMNGDYIDPPVRQDVIVFNKAGEIVKEIALPQGNLYGQVNWLHAIDVDLKGNIFLSDVVGNHVQKWKPATKAGK
ncbi:MAG: peptidylamidoglycolate lyase [Gammaproteobacteria bacterium]|jgi:peptidylamidoglycolate lyase